MNNITVNNIPLQQINLDNSHEITIGQSGKVDDVLVDGVSVVKDKIAYIGLRNKVIEILQEYGLISDEPKLTPAQIDAINNMTVEINENGELVVNYDNNLLSIDYSIIDGELMYVDNTGLIDSQINENKELEMIYNGD